MKHFIFLIFLAYSSITSAATYYVAPADSRGNDSAAGTNNAPWATLHKALQTAKAGDNAYVRSVVHHSIRAASVAK